jgi:polyribonucleotide 5'-hydroxyl-kinase
MPISSVMLLRASGIELSEGMKLVDSNADEAVKLVRVQASQDLMHSVVAVLHDDEEIDGTSAVAPSDPNDVPQHLLSSNIAGFLWIVQLDIERDVMSVLSPCPGALPSKYKALLIGSIKWVD